MESNKLFVRIISCYHCEVIDSSLDYPLLRGIISDTYIAMLHVTVWRVKQFISWLNKSPQKNQRVKRNSIIFKRLRTTPVHVG